MDRLQEALTRWQEASRLPGLLGRAGWSNVVSFRGHVASYFQAMADEMDLPGTPADNHYGMIEPHLRAIMSRAQPQFLSAYLAHARKALVLGAEQEAHLQEASASASIDRDSQEYRSLLKKLDHLGLTGQEAVDYVISHGAELVKGMDQYTLKVMRSVIANGIEKQRGVPGTVADIRKEFKDMTVKRARSIATTEMNDAMSEAALNKIKATGLDGKRWIASPGACKLCLDNKAQGIIPVNEYFQSGHLRTPGHPGKCRCATAGARLSDRIAA